MRSYERGDWVVYRKTKQKNRPARRARNIHPAPKGDTYTYDIDKYCRVVGCDPAGQLILLTRRSGYVTIAPTDSRLRRAAWWERLFRARLFPSWPPTEAPEAGSPGD